MLSSEEVQEIVRKKIEQDEKTGGKSVENEHLGFLDYIIDHIETIRFSDNKTEIRYTYRLIVETEFNYYSDDPPMEFPHKKSIVVDRKKKITEEKELDLPSDQYSTGEDFNWKLVQAEIKNHLQKLLDSIHRSHGKKFSAFQYPPLFQINQGKDKKTEYICCIKTERPDEGILTFTSEKPGDLVEKVRKDLQDRYLTP